MAIKMNGTVNCHNCVYWAPVNPHVHVGTRNHRRCLAADSDHFEHI
jgi:hypothetical protein